MAATTASPAARQAVADLFRSEMARPAPAAARSLVADILGLSYTIRVWTGPEWAALPREERPGDAFLMSDGASYCRITPAPVAAGGRLFATA